MGYVRHCARLGIRLEHIECIAIGMKFLCPVCGELGQAFAFFE